MQIHKTNEPNFQETRLPTNMDHLNRDGATIRDNNNGPFNQIDILEKELRSSKSNERVDGLRKIEAKLASTKRFAKDLIESSLLGLVIRLLVSGRSDEYLICRSILVHAKSTPPLLDAIMNAYYHDLLDAIYSHPKDTTLLQIIVAVSTSPRWVPKLKQSSTLVEFLTKQSHFVILQRIPEEAIRLGAVAAALQFLLDRTQHKKDGNVAALRFLLEATYFPVGREQAFQGGCLDLASDIILDEDAPSQALRAPAMGILCNLLQGPDHKAKHRAIDKNLCACLVSTLKSFKHDLIDPMVQLPKEEIDLCLFTLGTIAVAASAPSARDQLQSLIVSLQEISKCSPSALIQREAKVALEEIQWSP